MNEIEAFRVLDEVEQFLFDVSSSEPTLIMMRTADFAFLLPRFHRAKEFLRDSNQSSSKDRIQTLELQVKNFEKEIILLQSAVKKITQDVDTLNARISAYQQDRNLLVVRQLAYSYQTKLGVLVKAPAGKLSRTHEDISKMKKIDRQKFDEIEAQFDVVKYPDPVDINIAVNFIRELGSSHPTERIKPEDDEPVQSTYTAADLRSIINKLVEAAKMGAREMDIALDLLSVVEYMSAQLGGDHASILLG